MSQTYLVDYTYRVDTTVQDQHRPAHLDYLRDRQAAGQLLVSGPRATDEQPGGILVYRARDRADIEQIVAHDPFTVHDVVIDHSIRAWIPMSGMLVGAFASDEDAR